MGVPDGLQPRLQCRRTQQKDPFECSSRARDLNAGIMDAMGDSSRHSVTCSGTSGRNPARQLSRTVLDVELNSLERQLGMVTSRKGSARSKIDAKALQIVSD